MQSDILVTYLKLYFLHLQIPTMSFRFLLSLLIILQGNIHYAHSLSEGYVPDGDSFRHSVLVYHGEYYCNGVAIGEYHVLTARACVRNAVAEQFLIFASHNTSMSLMDSRTERYRVLAIEIPDNASSTFWYESDPSSYRLTKNIAILLLHSPLDIGIAQLPTTNSLQACMRCETSAWSLSHGGDMGLLLTLLWNPVMIMRPMDCYSQKIRHGKDGFCAAVESYTSQSDLGSGIVCDGILVGIMAYPEFGDISPVYYMKVYEYLSFIQRASEKFQLYMQAASTPGCA